MSKLDDLTIGLRDFYLKKLSDQELIEVAECLQVIADDQKYNKLENYLPDVGEFSRDKYKKHIDFMAAGKEYRERFFLSGNRIGKCISYNTWIELASGQKEKAGILYENKQPFEVLSLYGTKIVRSTVIDFIKKPPEDLYLITLENGETFECASNHRILSQSGHWQFVGELVRAFQRPLCSNLDNDQQVQFLNAHRSKETPQDFQSNCLEDFHFYGELLRLGEEVSRYSLLRQGDVLRRNELLCNLDDLGSKCTNIPQLAFDLLSTQDASPHVLDLSVFCQVQDLLLHALSEKWSTEISWRFEHLLGLVREVLGIDLLEYESLPALYSPFRLSGNRIISCNAIGVNDIYDFTVEKTHNYISHGIVHHNSECGAAETTYHLTGKYPHWWTGLRFNKPILGWVGGDTATTCRDIIQKKLLGEIGDVGSGFIPKELIIETKSRRNVPDAIETIRVRHVSGGISTCVIKTYEQGRATWQGTEVDWIWIDEEAPSDVYGEALIRLMTTNGSIITTFTPLNGVTELVLGALENSQDTDSKFPKYVQVVTWDDVPHISEEMKEQMLVATPPQLRDARSKGVPTVGSGLIYPVDPQYIVVDDFQVPKHWMRLNGMDVGWNNTACVFGAWDKDNDVIYVYSEHKQGQSEPVIHAKAIKARGEWIRTAIDPAARGRSQTDGESLFVLYQKEGLKIFPANNSVETGIFNVWERLTSGRLKIFKSCTGLLREFSLYHRDDKGKIVKNNDHLQDCLRYLCAAEHSLWSYPQQPQDRQKVIDISQYMRACV